MLTLIRLFIYVVYIATFFLHVWTSVIAYQESGLFACIISFLLPVLSEIYWFFKMWGENNIYCTLVVIDLVLSFLISKIDKDSTVGRSL